MPTHSSSAMESYLLVVLATVPEFCARRQIAQAIERFQEGKRVPLRHYLRMY
jgi:hypothetical protein